ncbi:MAG: hypothetical protein NW205_01110 [Hyphomicrobiaceae bacterium]|nr:hypothetical protein [Hyphomicrobiaceae bacterium]
MPARLAQIALALAVGIVLATIWWPKSDPLCFNCESDETRLLYGVFQLSTGASVERSELDGWWWSHKYAVAALHWMFGFSTIESFAVIARLFTTLGALAAIWGAQRILPGAGIATALFVALSLGEAEISRLLRAGLVIKPMEFAMAGLAVAFIAGNERWRSKSDYLVLAGLAALFVVARPNVVLSLAPVLIALAMARTAEAPMLPRAATLARDIAALPDRARRLVLLLIGCALVPVAVLATRVLPTFTRFDDDVTQQGYDNMFGPAAGPGIMGVFDFFAPRIWTQAGAPFTEAFVSGPFLRNEWWAVWALFETGAMLVVALGLAGAVAGAALARERVQAVWLAGVGAIAAQCLAALVDVYPIGNQRYGFQVLPLTAAALGLAWTLVLRWAWARWPAVAIGPLPADRIRLIVTAGVLTIGLVAASVAIDRVRLVRDKVIGLNVTGRAIIAEMQAVAPGTPFLTNLYGLYMMPFYGLTDEGRPRVIGNAPGEAFVGLLDNVAIAEPDLSAATAVFGPDILIDARGRSTFAEEVMLHCASGRPIALYSRHPPAAHFAREFEVLKAKFTPVSERRQRYLHFSIWKPAACDAAPATPAPAR